MKLTKLKVQNFRGIEELEINVHDFLTLIGANNSGKSSVIRAIEIFLEQLKPEPDEFRKNVDFPIVMEGTFEDIQDWERNKPAASGLINEDKIWLRRTIGKDDSPRKKTYEANVKPINGWAEKYGELDQSIKSFVSDQYGIDRATEWNQQKGEIKEYILNNEIERITLGDSLWTSENISIDNALQQVIPQAVIVPAVKDAADDSSPGAKTSFGKLLKRIVLPAIQSSSEYENMITAVEVLANKMKAEDGNGFEKVTKLAEELTESISDILKAKVIFKMNAPDTEKFLGANAGMNLNDGVETPVHLQGHGAQRALIYAMIENIAQQNSKLEGEDNKRSTILLFEEPEIYLHPHLMRKLKKSLQQISSRSDWQVVITTHSPFFVDVAEKPTSLVIISKDRETAKISRNQLEEDPFNIADGQNEREALRAALDFHPTVSEAFFAERIVLVEGDTELAALKHSSGIHESYNISAANYLDTTIVSCGGKWTIPAMARVLHAFGLPFRIIHDLDKKGRNATKLGSIHHLDPYKANEKIIDAAGGADIHLVEDTFENVLWAGEEVKSSNKPYRAWCKIKEIIEKDEAGNYPKLKDIFEFAYNW